MNPFRIFLYNLAEERERWFLWLPAGAGAGIVLYFALPGEPPALLLGLTPGLSGLLIFVRRHGLAGLLLAVPLSLALGFNAAQIETKLDAAPMLNRSIGPGPIEGRLMRTEVMPEGTRLTLQQVKIGHVPEAQTPWQVRIKVKQKFEDLPPPGTRVSLWGQVGPPSEPVAPGAYDFRRQFYFKGTGGTGWAYGEIRLPEDTREPPGIYDSVALFFERARHSLTRHVGAELSGDAAAMTAALLNGEQSSIGKEVMQAMRVSGLVHLLSISGVHVAMTGVLVYFPLRALLAMIPFIALRFPIKKWAAGAAIIATVAYTFLVGPETPTLRSMLMTSIVMLTIIADRRATSMRLVALSALIVMLIFPDGVVGASFQMSFAAVLAMIAAYERPLDAALREQTIFDLPGWIEWLKKHFGSIIGTSIVATAATTPFTIYHFQTFSFYGVVANMFAIPLTSFWIMPNILLAYLTAPFGWDAPFIIAASWGVSAIIAVARQVESWPYALLHLPAMPDAAFIAVVSGFLWLCLWRRRWRYAGVLPIVIGMLYPLYTQQPDVFIADSGRQWMARLDDGRFAVASLKKEKFILSQWQQRVGGGVLVEANAAPTEATSDIENDDGDDLAESAVSGTAPEMRCDGVGCVYRHAGHVMAFTALPTAAVEDCAMADIVLASVALRGCKAAIVVDEPALWRQGGHTLRFQPDGVKIEVVRAKRGLRPWSPGWKATQNTNEN